MTLLTNGDFSDGLNGWTVTQAGATGPEADPNADSVIFGGANDVTSGDSISQGISLTAGEEVTVTITLEAVEGPNGGGAGGGIGVFVNSATQGDISVGNVQIFSAGATTVTLTITPQFDVDTFRIEGQFAFGGSGSFLRLGGVTVDQAGAPCFTKGTMIDTPSGRKAIETLKVGDLVETLDHGPQAIRWIGTRSIKFTEQSPHSKLRPIVIRAGALGREVPNVDMRVSRQHRMLISSKIAERMFDAPQVLIPAVRLLVLPNVELDEEVQEIDYLHVMFDHHQVIWADGAPSESFLFGPEAMKSISHEAREEVEALFPELVSGEAFYEPARIIPIGKRQKKLIERHVSNVQNLVSDMSPVSGLQNQVGL